MSDLIFDEGLLALVFRNRGKKKLKTNAAQLSEERDCTVPSLILEGTRIVHNTKYTFLQHTCASWHRQASTRDARLLFSNRSGIELVAIRSP